MPLPIFQRLAAAWSLVVRGSVSPWDRIGSASLAGPEKLTKPYATSVWVHAAIRHIATPIAGVALEHSTQGGTAGTRRIRAARRLVGRQSADTLITDPRLDAFWDAPAVGIDSLSEFISAVVGWRKLAGEAFLILGDDALVPFPEVRPVMAPLVIARPDRMRHLVRDGQLLGWEFTDGSGRRHSLLPDQVIHLKQWNPYDDWRGLGEFEVARLAAETDAASSAFARNLAASQGDQGVYVVAKNGVVEQAQRDQITALLMEKRRLQQAGIFRPVFLTGDITVEDPKVRSLDASFLESRRMSAAEIYVAFGVPPSMAKEQASYSIGSASDYFRLISDTCIPESQRLADAIGRVSSILLGRDVVASWCWDEHPVMQEVRKERFETVDKLWSKGVPLRAISDYLDLDLPRFPGDDTGWLPVSVVPAGDAAALSLDPGPEGEAPPAPPSAPSDSSDPSAPSDPQDPVQSALRALRAGRSPAARATPAGQRLWERHMRLRQPVVRAYQTAFTRELTRVRAEVLRRIESQYRPEARQGAFDASSAITTGSGLETGPSAQATRGGEASPGLVSTRAGAVDLLFDLGEFTARLIASFRRVAMDALTTAGKQLFAELGKDDPFTYPPAKALEFIASRDNRVSGMAEEVFDSLKAHLQAGLNDGDSIAQLSARVRTLCNDMSKGRAKRIAMTETAAAYGTARQEGMRQAGVPWKRWLNSGGDNVREAHIEANNQTVPVTEPFEVGGEQLMHPGDPDGRPDNIINCHCVAVAVASEDDGLNTDAPANA